MKNKKKKAFTLVELLAVIVILAIILVIAIPQIMNTIKAARISSFKDSAILIAEQAEKDYLSQQVLNKDYNNTSIPCEDVAKLNNDYDSCNITYNNGIATVRLKGSEKGKFSNITCEGTKDNMECSESIPVDAVTYLMQLVNQETTMENCDGIGKLIKVTHDNGDVDYHYAGQCPNNYVSFNDEYPIVDSFYTMYADGDISTNVPRVGYHGGYEFPDETTCINSGLNGSFTSLGYESDTPAKCVLNNTTNKYYIEAHGYLNNIGPYKSKEDCENSYSSQGMGTSSALSCRKNPKYPHLIGGWRIIGIFDINGEKRIKLVRNDLLGPYSWDTSESSVNSGSGFNEWSQSDLMQELNGDYLNPNLLTDQIWYNGQNNNKNAIFNKENVLKANAQELIGEALWYLGGGDIGVSKEIQYSNERGSSTCKTINKCTSDNIERTTRWTGKVGLIYPSDFAYASNNINCGNDLRNNCQKDNWLTTEETYWTLTPNAYYSARVQIADSYGIGHYSTANVLNFQEAKARPSVYLKSGIKITGEGTVENPYTFSK